MSKATGKDQSFMSSPKDMDDMLIELAHWKRRQQSERHLITALVAQQQADKEPSDPYVYARVFTRLWENRASPEDYGMAMPRANEYVQKATSKASYDALH